MSRGIKFSIADVYELGSMQDRIDFKVYESIWKKFGDRIFKELIKEGSSFKMPNGIGTLTIYKKETKRSKSVNYKLTKDLGYTVYHTNYHSDNQHAYIDWDTYHPCKTIFKFKAIRRHTRHLAKCIKDDNAINTYFEKE